MDKDEVNCACELARTAPWQVRVALLGRGLCLVFTPVWVFPKSGGLYSTPGICRCSSVFWMFFVPLFSLLGTVRSQKAHEKARKFDSMFCARRYKGQTMQKPALQFAKHQHRHRL
ncbi:hypothetical protein C8Q70DRAFT_415367 [Cubamyces menziesii]|nr:hypothetical protein C8Q70DRAFT_415367 [Cubamyces menziesii]